MKDYASMSDQQINREVQKLTGIGCMSGNGVLIIADGRWRTFAPCNNPADAWPIITENKISIYAMSETDARGKWGAEAFYPSEAYHFNDNPLRAAMIVFLMMKEGE